MVTRPKININHGKRLNERGAEMHMRKSELVTKAREKNPKRFFRSMHKSLNSNNLGAMILKYLTLTRYVGSINLF